MNNERDFYTIKVAFSARGLGNEYGECGLLFVGGNGSGKGLRVAGKP